MATLAIARRLVEELSREQPDALELACLASLAVRVDPGLLRRLRLELLPGSSPAIEADLWLSELVGFRGPQGIVFAKKVGAVLREKLAARGAERYEQVWRITEETHRWLAPALQLEEKLNYLQFCRAPDAHAQTLGLLQSALATLVREPEGGLGHWAAGASERLPQELMHLTEGRLLAVAAQWSLGGELLSSTPAFGEEAGWLASIARKETGRVRLSVKMFSSHVELGPEGGPSDNALEIPRTEPLVVDVAEEEVHPRRWRVFISYSPRDGSQWVSGLTSALRSAGHEVLGTDDTFRLGEPFTSAIPGAIQQADAVILLVSKGALGSVGSAYDARVALERKRNQGELFTLIPVYLDKATPATMARRWSWATALLSIQGILADRRSPSETITRILAALERPIWRRVELSASRPTRIALREGQVRLRTLLGEEHSIEPMLAGSHLRMPPPPPTFLGYRAALSQAIETIRRSASFLYLHGPSGSGKTSLIRLASDAVASDFPDGIFYLQRRKEDPPFSARAVAQEVLAALGVDPDAGHRNVLEQYYNQTSERRFLLVLDGLSSPSVDQDIPSADLEALLPGPGASLVIVGKHEGRWTALDRSIPMQAIRLEGLDPSAATDLVLQFAPHLDEAEIPWLIEACCYLPGPLRSVAEALSRRDDLSFDLIEYATHLEAARLLYVFPDSFDREAALAVLNPRKTIDSKMPPRLKGILDEAFALVFQEKVRMGLVQPTSAPGRFMLWTPIRQVADARPDLLDRPSTERLHVNHFAFVLRKLDAMYRTPSFPRTEVLQSFEQCWPDIAAAVERLYQHPADQIRFTFGSSPLIRLQGPPNERLRWQQNHLEHCPPNHQDHAALRLGLALTLADLGNLDDALKHLQQVLATSRLDYNADSFRNEVRVEVARLHLEAMHWADASETASRINADYGYFSRYQKAQTHYVIAMIGWQAMSPSPAEAREVELQLWEAWTLAQDAGDVRLEVDTLLALGLFNMEQGALGPAESRFIQALEFAESFRDDRGAAQASWNLGRVRVRQGNLDEARKLLRRLVDHERAIGHAQAEERAEAMKRLLRQSS